MIDAVLEYSKAVRKAGKEKMVDLNELLQDTIAMLAVPKAIAISFEDILPTIKIDPFRIEQVFQNLISNAVQHMGKTEGNISISCKDTGENWLFKVSDDGPGIDEKYHEIVFQVFQTLKSNDDSRSTGVGLSTVKKIIQNYHGEIWIESQAGKGADFCFTIPKNRNKL
jgi:signal transduction histidine kinase